MSRVAAAGIVRSRDDRRLGGVCAGLAGALGVTPLVVRLAVLGLALAAGPVVIVLYILGWSLLPTAPADDETAEEVARATRRPLRRSSLAPVLAILVGGILVLSDLSADVPASVFAPVLLAGVGAALVWRRTGSARGSSVLNPLRLAFGATLVLVGGVAMLAAVSDLRTIGHSAAAAAVALVGVGLLLGPGLARLARDLADERRRRIRSQERAEVAAHLHDGVLQTLALIQKRADDGRTVRSLARRQERELRSWLYGAPVPGEPDTLAALLQRELDEAEDRYGVRLDAVLVGDAPLDDATRALVAAGREAVQNAARHAGVDVVDVYLEVEPDRIALFVRDRGHGFDVGAIPADRRGLRESILGRLGRHGGDAAVRSAPGEGTEVELSVPRAS